jgi:hypothetical protein
MTGLFQRRFRGFRIVELVIGAVLVVLMLSVYLAKAGAGRERSEIAQVQASIEEERTRMKLLRAEVAYLEQPERIERLSTMIGLTPITARREASVEALPQLALAGPPPSDPKTVASKP